MNPVDERSPAGSDFSANLCERWEQQSLLAKSFARHVSLVRTGLVLSTRGGFLAPQVKACQWGLGVTMGRGNQIISWVDEDDWLAAILFIIKTKMDGPINITAPGALPQKEFIQTLCTRLNRPLWLRIPLAILNLIGEMKTLFRDGQSVQPSRLNNAGYSFKYPELSQSLQHLLDEN